MKLLLTGAFKYSEEQLDSLKSLGYEILFIQDERASLEVDVSDIDAVVCNGLFQYNDIKKFENLKFIQLTSAGLDRVPLDYINDQGLKLFNAKGVYSVPMAEWVVLKILEIYKKSRKFYEAQRDHKWEKQRDLLELTNKTVAIIGYGSVGAEVAKRLKAFGANVIGVGRTKSTSKLLDEYYNIENVDEVIRKSDILVLTVPYTCETRHLIDSSKMAIMKHNSIIVNVSRGGVIDEKALITFLKSNKFLGVALDVFEKEPLSEYNELWTMDRVIVTPHNSFYSNKVNARMFSLILDNLCDFNKLGE